MSKYIPSKTKKRILKRQSYKCNNIPGSNSYNLYKFECPLWTHPSYQGTFVDSIYEIDHVIEWCISHDNSESNLQALCPYCHAAKTKNFAKIKKEIQLTNNNYIEKSTRNNYRMKICTFINEMCFDDPEGEIPFNNFYDLFCDYYEINEKNREIKLDTFIQFINLLGYDIIYQHNGDIIRGLEYCR